MSCGFVSRRRRVVQVSLALLCGCGGDVPSEPEHVLLAAGGESVCVVQGGRRMRCWGRNDGFALGMGTVEAMVGDDEVPASLAAVEFDGEVQQVAVDVFSGCAVLGGGGVRCWGMAPGARFGLRDWPGNLGDDESLMAAPRLDLGELPGVRSASVGNGFSCLLFEDSQVRCFGSTNSGVLGIGDASEFGEIFGDAPSEPLAAMRAVELGGPVARIATGSTNTCAVLESGDVRCWGRQSSLLGLGPGAAGTFGEHLGDDEVPAQFGPIRLAGGRVEKVSLSTRHACALHADGRISCWGQSGPWLGLEVAVDDPRFGPFVGDDEDPADVGTISIPETFVDVCVSIDHTCALTGAGAVRCWGGAAEGQLGQGSTERFGTDQPVSEVPDVPLGQRVVSIACGDGSTCAQLEGGDVRCWGRNQFGVLGLGRDTSKHLGDDEAVTSVPPVDVG